ncbi:MAG: hypothetical protein ACK6CU_09940 [Deltaproteobacteria bacterium]
MNEPPFGFDYHVSDEQIATYSALPIHVRLAWVEETARLVYALSTPEVRARWAALRRGEPMPAPDDPA